MKTLIKIELFKLIKSKKNKKLILLLIIFCIGIAFVEYSKEKNYNLEMTEYYGSLKEDILTSRKIFRMEEINFNKPIPWDEDAFLEKEYNYSTYLECIYKYEKEEDPNLLASVISRTDNIINGFEKGYINENSDLFKYRDLTDLHMDKVLYDYILNNGESAKINPHEMNGLRYIQLLHEGYIPLIIAAIILSMVIDIFFIEMSGSYKNTYSTSFSRKEIYKSKIISTLIFITVIYLSLIAIGFIICSLIFGFGLGEYPTIISKRNSFSFFTNNEHNYKVLPVKRKATISILLYLLNFLILSNILISMTVILNSYEIPLAIYFFSVLIYFTYRNTSLFRSLDLLLPVNYLRVDDILTGKLTQTIFSSLLILILVSFIFGRIGVKFLEKTDLVGN